jgi:hypothetical protein
MFNEADMKCGFQQLPPSIRIVQGATTKSKITSQGSTHGVCDVAYYIETRLFLKGQLVSGASREIMVMPIAVTPPPIEPGDLVNEYRLFATSSLSTSWRRKHAITVSISSSEPRALVFESARLKDGGVTADCIPTTELLLNFSARQTLNGDSCDDIIKPEIRDCDLTLALEATTYFLRHEEHSVLSITEARNIPFSVVKTTRFKSQRLKVRLLNWKRVNEANGLACKS